VWDTGASFGFLDYDVLECNITVWDISQENIVVSIGTTLHKFQIDGEDIFLSCLWCHLPSAEVWLFFSPQTYHTLYDGHSVVGDEKVGMYIDHLQNEVDID
jgi:hypothetical protein